MAETDYFKYDHSYYLSEARGMSSADLKNQIKWLESLVDDDGITTGEMQLQYSAYKQALEEKTKV